MTFQFEISPDLERTIKGLERKDHNLAVALRKKMKQIIDSDSVSILHYKNLMGNLSHLKRVQVGSFILTFQVRGDTILFEDFVHHDKAYD